MTQYFTILFFSFIFTSANSYAILNVTPKQTKSQEKSTIKANKVQSTRDKNVIKAIGNVEVSNANTVALSEEISYDKKAGIITSPGEIKVIDLEIGNLFAKNAQVKDDFSQGFYHDGILIFNDGSYFQSKKIERNNENTLTLSKPFLSICPNDEIVKDDRKATKLHDFLSMKSSKTVIDQEKRTVKSTHNIIKIYDLPVLYLPYIKFPMKSKKRQSGFLSPSYVNNSRFGIGVNIPYFIDAAPNIDLTVTPRIYKDSNQITINNQIKHLTKYGEHETNFEISNNEVTSETDTNVVNRTDKKLRYDFRSEGNFIFTNNSSANHKIQTVGDRDYLRDYNFDFKAFTTSQASYSYNKGRDYFGVTSVRFQELEPDKNEKQAQWVLPSITYQTESKKHFFFKEKYKLTSNFTAINRDSGLQYKRLSVTPEVNLPFNIHGNLFALNAKLDFDYYAFENNYKFGEEQKDYNKTQSNYKPEFSATWRLPLIQKLKSNTLMLEPMANFVSSSAKTNFNKLANEDSNDSELTVNNLFTTDRIAGYDRNEVGERINYGIKSAMFNKFGQFELSLGQSYRINEDTQDVAIRGFNSNNKSNIVGQASYILPEIFDITYLFQLDEGNYRNDVNSIIANLNFKKFIISNDYLLIRRGIINAAKLEQNTFRVNYKLNKKVRLKASITKNLVTGKNLNRSASVEYGGCCVFFAFTTTESNTSNLTKTQRSHSINVTIKGL